MQAGTDSIPFVYQKNGDKQVVVLGESNENNVIIEQGLEPGTQIYLSTPEKPENFKLTGAEFIPVIRDRVKAKKVEEQRYREESEMARVQRDRQQGDGRMNMTPGMMYTRNQQQGQKASPRDTTPRVKRTRQPQQ